MMPNAEELLCPVCKKPGKDETIRLSDELAGTVSIYTKLTCAECKMYWTADKGWRPLNPPKSMTGKQLADKIECGRLPEAGSSNEIAKCAFLWNLLKVADLAELKGTVEDKLSRALAACRKMPLIAEDEIRAALADQSLRYPALGSSRAPLGHVLR